MMLRIRRRETTELSPVPSEIYEDVEESVYKALSLTRINLFPEDLHVSHSMNRSNRVIIKFKCRKQKQSLLHKRKNLGTKSHELTNLEFSLCYREYVSWKSAAFI